MSIPYCSQVRALVEILDRPSEDKLRTPDAFKEEVDRYRGYCKDAVDAIKDIRDCMDACDKGLAEANEDGDEQEADECRRTKANCMKLLAEWQLELQRRNGILAGMEADYNAGKPLGWQCGLKTEATEHCENEANFVYGKWSYCKLHRDIYGERP